MKRIVRFDETSVPGFQTWIETSDLASLLIEFDDSGRTRREIGLNGEGQVIHRHPGTPTLNSDGIMGPILVAISGEAPNADAILMEESHLVSLQVFEDLWTSAPAPARVHGSRKMGRMIEEDRHSRTREHWRFWRARETLRTELRAPYVFTALGLLCGAALWLLFGLLPPLQSKAGLIWLLLPGMIIWAIWRVAKGLVTRSRVKRELHQLEEGWNAAKDNAGR